MSSSFFDSSTNLAVIGTTLIIGSAVAYLLQKPNKAPPSSTSSTISPSSNTPILPSLPSISVYFGSQTGTSEGFSRTLLIEGKERGFDVEVVDLEDLDIDSLPSHWASKANTSDPTKATAQIFLMATYGEGEPTDNAADFIRYLKRGVKDGEEDLMKDVPYCVFGLGNTQYEHYNEMGKFVNTSIEKLGGKRVMPLGMGDDDKAMDDDFDAWKETLWKVMEETYKVGTSSSTPGGRERAKSRSMSMDDLPTCMYECEPTDEKLAVIPAEKDINSATKHYFNCYDVKVVKNIELRSEKDGGSTKHIEVDLSKAKAIGSVKSESISYVTADNSAVLPVNNVELVKLVASKLGFKLEDNFKLVVNKSADEKTQKGFKHVFPTPCTVETCLSRYCDLTAVPRKSELKILALYARDKVDRDALLRMSSKEGKEEYKEKIEGMHVGLSRLITEFVPSVRMTLPQFIAFCPRMVPRYYTISSSSSVEPKKLAMTVSVIKEENFSGVCSTHLSNADSCRIFIRPSTFRLPADLGTPIVMIGPGTGVAPMRALCLERKFQQKKLGKGKRGKNILYFGCKNREQDFLYKDEMEGWKKEGVLDELHLAFSREQKEKVYVQNLLEQNGEETWKAVEEGAHFYICGGTRMGKDVVVVLQKICEKFGSVGNGVKFCKKMSEEGRLVQELWS